MKTRTITTEIYDIPYEERGTTDYLYAMTKWTTKEERKKWNVWDIFINGAVCKHCGDYIRSFNQHDFKMCSCGKVWVDWGSHYWRRIGEPDDYINVIEYFNKK